jgi:hypothetical protein
MPRDETDNEMKFKGQHFCEVGKKRRRRMVGEEVVLGGKMGEWGERKIFK